MPRVKAVSAALGWLSFALAAVAAAPQDTSRAKDPQAQALIRGVFTFGKSAKTVEDYGKVIEICEQILALEEASNDQRAYAAALESWALNRRGQLYVAQAKKSSAEAERWTELAFADFERAIYRDANRWRAIHNRGLLLARQQKYYQARLDFDEVIRLQPSHFEAWFNRAEVRLAVKEFEGAIRDYSYVLESNPADVAALLGRGRAFLAMLRHDEALEDFDRVVARNATAPTLVARATVHAKRRSWSASLADYERALELSPDSAAVCRGAAWLLATCPDDQIRNPARALELAERAKKYRGEDFRVLDTLAAALAAEKKFDEAQGVLKQAIRLAPQSEHWTLRRRWESYRDGHPYRDGASHATALAP